MERNQQLAAWARVMVVAALVIWAVVMTPTAVAQSCSGQWLPGEGQPGVNGTVRALTLWDPDGPGPEQAKVVVGGSFQVAGNVVARNIATFDPQTGVWGSLGGGIGLGAGSTDSVNALAVMPNGHLIAAGSFRMTAQSSETNIARWDGSAWSSIVGPGGVVNAVLVLPNGDLIAGYSTSNPGVWRWNGRGWSVVGGGFNGAVNALTTLPNGDLIAGGSFSSAGGVPASSVARWSSATGWQPLAGGVVSGTVLSLARLSNGFAAAGEFTVSLSPTVSSSRIARWDAGFSRWAQIGVAGNASGLNATAHAVLLTTGGNLLIGGAFSTFATTATQSTVVNGVARAFGPSFDCCSLAPVGTGVNSASGGGSAVVRAVLELPGGDLIVAGEFGSAGGVLVSNIARWNGSAWSPLGRALNAPVTAITRLSNGAVAVGGLFTSSGGLTTNSVATWNGLSWSTLGSGMNGAVWALLRTDNGLIAGGEFTVAGGVAASRVARWNGSAWVPLGSGMNGHVWALAQLPNGDVVAGGAFSVAGGVPANGVARWNGSAWVPMGSGLNDGVYALATLPNGDVIAGGAFTSAGGVAVNRIARWDGNSWSPLGVGMNGSVWALAVLPNGDLVAGGEFGMSSGVGVARWNGVSWDGFGTFGGQVYALHVIDDGRLAVGGSGIAIPQGGTSETVGVAVWLGGTAWQSIGRSPSSGLALGSFATGELAIGGSFTSTDPIGSAYIARYAFSGSPTVAAQPSSRDIPPGQTLMLSTAPTNGYSNVSVQWFRNGQPITSGPGGASPDGGTVSGANATLASPTSVSMATLTITNPQFSDSGTYSAVFSNACGSATTVAATVGVFCPTDYGRDGSLNLDDLSDFITDFYMDPPIPGGLQPGGPTYADLRFASVPCPNAPSAPAPYAADAYLTHGYRVGFSSDGSNACPADPLQTFPSLDNLAEFITEYYAAFTAGGC
jgi:trimeric autotransporter adhesin